MLNMKTRFLFICLFPFFLFSQGNLEINKSLPNDVRWVKQSSEYKKLCEQIYRSAALSMRNRVATTENPVIVMDLDETVLDNSQYQVELFLKSEKYNIDSWNKWVKTKVSTLVPGAKQFITRYKNNQNAKIIFISNRTEETLKATKNNMKKLGIYFKDDIFLLKRDSNDTKTIRRNEVFSGSGRMKKYGKQTVIAYFGDAMGDFPDDERYVFSVNKFIFPNPMYGKW